MANVKVVLADPPRTKSRHADTQSFPNVGILSLFGYLREQMSGLDLCYLNGTLDLRQHLERVAAISPHLYGLSFASTMESVAYETMNQVKEKNPDLPVICGGCHPTALPEEVLQESKADICVIGEGEETLREVIEFYTQRWKGLDQIKGLAYRKDGRVVRTPPRPFIRHMDSIPMIAWDMVDFKDYTGNPYRQNRAQAPDTCILTSRGCPYNCVFCSNPVWRTAKPWLRVRSPEKITAEVDYLYGRGIRELYIRADEFNSSVHWCLKVCQEIKKLNHADLFFQCNLRADKVPEELAHALDEINCRMVHLGIESLNQRVLDGIQKQITVEQVMESCRTLKKYDIKVYGFFMLYQAWEEGGQLCWETSEEVNHSLVMIRKMWRAGLLDYMSWQLATPVPGSRLYAIARKHNLVKPGHKIESFWDVNLQLPGISESRMRWDRAKGMIQQSVMALKAGGINWKAWPRVVNKVKYILEAV